MFADTLPSDEMTEYGMRGCAEMAFACVNGHSKLSHLYQQAPLRVLFPHHPAHEPATAAIVTTSGGLVGGDRLSVDVTAHAGAQALVTAQAAEKVYRSRGPDCRIDVRLTVEDGAWLEWLPQETILFDGARLRRLTAIERKPGGRILAGEILVFGRTARDERLQYGLIHDGWEIRRDGRLIWSDALHLDGDLAHVLNHRGCFAGAAAFATAAYVGDDAADRLVLARGLIENSPARASATVVQGVLVMRWLGNDALDVRRAFGAFWTGFRHAVAGLAATLPRLWHI